MQEKYVKSHDHAEIFYKIQKNTAPWLIFLPGPIYANHTILSHQTEHFMKDYSVLTLDLNSQKITHLASYSLTDFALDVKTIMEYENIKKATIIGYSLGGIVALKCVDMFPELFTGMILLNSTYNFMKTAPVSMQLMEKARLSGLIKELQFMVTKLSKEPSSIDYPDFSQFDASRLEMEYMTKILKNTDRIMRQSWVAVESEIRRLDLDDALERISIPSFFIAGKEDTTVLPVASWYMASVVENSKAYTIKDAGHDMVLTHPKTVNTYIEMCLKRIY